MQLLLIICTSSFFGSTSGENLMINTEAHHQIHSVLKNNGYINITVQEVWEMCSTISNGITPPIDVRSDLEWQTERINTPYPEYPRNFELTALQTESGLQEFMNKYNGTDVIMTCGVGGRSAKAAQILVANNFNGVIYNMIGGITAWKQANLPVKIGNTPPLQPTQPIGSTICSIGSLFSFQTMGSDPDNDVIRYGWNWNGDMIIDSWSDYVISGTTIETSTSWINPGQYNVTVISEDIVGERSTSSLSLTVLVTTPPSDPVVNGPQSGKTNEEQTFSFYSNDIDNDDVLYFIDWDDDTTSDGWLGPYMQGTSIDVTHTWTEKNTYSIQVKAKDINGIESGWSTFEIRMPKSPMVNFETLWRSLGIWIWSIFKINTERST